MKAMAPAILYALFVWWFATGIVLLLVLRRNASRVALWGSAVLYPVSLVVLAKTADLTSITGAYAAFTAAILIWGTQEVAFLTGVLTGPRPRPCPPGARGFDRFCYAVSAILYHEIALFISGAAVLIATMGHPNQVGALTFLVLWVMRLSAKFNLFFGVPVLNDEALPAKISFIRSYFRRAPANSFFPVAMGLALLGTWTLIDDGLATSTSAAAQAGDMLVAVLLGLAIIEHVFMVVPLPIERLWRWSTRGANAGSTDGPSEPPARRLDQAVPTRT